jgi:O-acetyl-ADP-ribose deacetylase
MATIEVLDTDITRLEVDAIASAANTRLIHGGGVAGAIARAGGPEVEAESPQRGPIAPGKAIETTGRDALPLGDPRGHDVAGRPHLG